MIGLERFTPGTTSHAVARRLHQVHDEATVELAGVPDHQRLMHRLIVCWLDKIHEQRSTWDRMPVDMALAQHTHQRPAPSRLGPIPGVVDQLLADLTTYEWLEPVHQVGTTMWRPRIGVRFVPAELSRTPARRRTTARSTR